MKLFVGSYVVFMRMESWDLGIEPKVLSPSLVDLS